NPCVLSGPARTLFRRRFDVRERADAEPLSERPAQARAAMSRRAARRERGLECENAAPDANEIRQGPGVVQLRRTTGTLPAKLPPPVLVQEPPTALSLRLIGKLELDDRSTGSEALRMRALLERPQEQAQIHLVLGQLSPGPPLSPDAERRDDRHEFLARRGQVVRPSSVRRLAARRRLRPRARRAVD